MKVQHDGRLFLIEFAYYPADSGPLPEYRECTACKILDGSAPRADKQPAPTICVGTARRHFKDPPNREVGRKAALKVALGYLDATLPAAAETAAEGKTRDKERRRLFWDVLRNRKNPRSSEVRSSGAETQNLT